ncbi:uncharacterized protein SCHCODRAFT_01039430 [Schizophyllum commune H4-8]|uniref:Expressed protein n=1 Tax=Schizophyllum commune (strain H4-8 / FGSC 9210) TaxID=578458 RepID=D8QGM6_SCHCM|nr:uncharacterized protein SCHCODRAFT_01039430 [Schizophyllum commune H4-8]KAI5886781.1 hypothetical protein SCHCODRAFT_01039430 [Schizophyllum commune H4-8]
MAVFPVVPHIIRPIEDPQEYRKTVLQLWDLFDVLPLEMRPALNPGTGYPRGNAFQGGWMYLLDRAIRYARHLKNELAMLEAVMGVAPLMRYAVQDEIPPIIVAPSIEQYLRQNAFFRLLWKELPEGYGAGADPESMRDIVREAIKFIREMRATVEHWYQGLGTSDVAHSFALLHAPTLPTDPPKIQTHSQAEPWRRLDEWVVQSKVRWELGREARAEGASALARAVDPNAGEDGIYREEGLTEEEKDAWRRLRADALLAADLREAYDEYDLGWEAPGLGGAENPMALAFDDLDGASNAASHPMSSTYDSFDEEDPMGDFSEEEADRVMRFYNSGYDLSALDSEDGESTTESEGEGEGDDDEQDCGLAGSGLQGAGSLTGGLDRTTAPEQVKRGSFSCAFEPADFDMSLDEAMQVVERQMAADA